MIPFVMSLLLGVAVGILSGALGVGGGGVMVPVLVLGLGIDQATAQGTSLVAILPTAASGAAQHLRKRVLDVRLASLLGVSGVAGAVLGALLALHLDRHVLRELFAIFLLVVAAQTLWRAFRPRPQDA